MFGSKPKGWEDLSPEDYAWAKTVTPDNWLIPCLCAITDRKAARIRFLVKSIDLPEPHKKNKRAPNATQKRYADYHRAALAAVAEGSREMMMAVMEERGFAFSAYGDRDHYYDWEGDTCWVKNDVEYAGLLFKNAGNNIDTWRILLELNRKEKRGHLSGKDFKNAIPSDTASPELIRFVMDNIPDISSDAFIDLFKGVGMKDKETFELILAYTLKSGEEKRALFAALEHCVKHFDTERVKRLLESGADANTGDGSVLQHAIDKNSRALFDILLPAINLDQAGRKVLMKMKEKNPVPPLTDLLEVAINRGTTNISERDIRLVDKNTVAEIQMLPNGLRLTTSFNFLSRQQMIITEKTGDAQMLSAISSTFNSLDNPEYIEHMRQKLVELGGAAEPFVHILPKQGSLPKN